MYWNFDVKPPKQKSSSRARSHQTQWAAQFAVASELCKRGYEVALTMGHTTPIADLMVVSPVGKKMFLVDVKGLYRMNPWIIKRKEVREQLFYVLAYVPPEFPNQFFVLTQQQIEEFIRGELKRLGRPDDYSVTGFVWKLALPFKDAWHVLPK
jgi:hypothetical protein